MTDINRLLNSTSAGMIAKKLDAKDGENGKIEASIWKNFINEIGTGNNNVKEFISVGDAINSITKYLVNTAKKTGKNIETIANEWLGRVAGNNSTDGAKGTENTKGTDNAANTEIKSGNKKPVSQSEADYNNIKVTIPETRFASNQVKAILKNQKIGESLAAKLRKGNSRGINKDNVAYALNKVPNLSFGPNSQELAKYLFQQLVDKMDGLEKLSPNDCSDVKKFAKLSYGEQRKLLQNYKDRIINEESEIIYKDKSYREYQNKNQAKIQKTFDDANRFLADVANMEEKPDIQTLKNGAKQAKLPDGRYINVNYYKGEIETIMISYNTTKNNQGQDEIEVLYEKEMASYNIDKNRVSYDGTIYSGYDFEKLKAVAEKIFG